jgi:hypothetical protein
MIALYYTFAFLFVIITAILKFKTIITWSWWLILLPVYWIPVAAILFVLYILASMYIKHRFFHSNFL